MAQIELTYGADGERLTIDNDIATEATLNQLAKSMGTLSSSLKVQMKTIMQQQGKDADQIAEAIGESESPDVVKELKAQTDAGTVDNQKLINVIDKTQKEANTQRKKQAEQDNKAKKLGSYFQKKMGDNFSFFGSVLQKLVTSIFTIGASGITLFLTSVQNLGNGLKSLTDVGGAFGDVQRQGTVSTVDNIVALNQLGLTTEQAVDLLSNFSKTSAVLGQSVIPRLNKQFLQLTNFGSDLGVALDDATQFFQEDLAFRTSILLRDRINQFETARASEQGIKNLRMFSTLLGRSGDDLRNESRTVIDTNKAFQQLLVTLGPMGEEVVNATDSLFQGLKGANVPDEVLQGILDVATIGSEAASDFINALGPFAPELRDELTGLGMAIRNGSITMDSVQTRVLGVLNSVQSADTGNLKQLVASLPNDLQGVVQSLIGFSVDAENARNNFRGGEISGRFSDIQRALTNFENVLKLEQGALGTFKNSLVLGAEQGLTSFADALGSATDANSKLSQIAKRVGETLGGIFNRFINRIFGSDFANNFDSTLNSIINGLNKFGDRLINFVDDVLDGFFDKKGQFNLIQGLSNYLLEVLGVGLDLFFKALIEVLPAAIFALFTNLKVVGALAGAFLTLLLGSAVISAIQTGLLAWWMGMTPTMLGMWGTLMAKMGLMSGGRGFVGPMMPGGGKGKFLRGAGIGSLVVGGAMVAKDGFDIVAGTDGGATGENKGGVLGGLGGAGLGAAIGSFILPGIGTMIGAGLGAIVGNMAGGTIGSNRDRKKEELKEAVTSQNQPANTSVTVMRQPTREGMRLSFLDKAAYSDSMDGMSVSERRDVDEMTNEAKLLTLILSESKTQNRKLQAQLDKKGQA